MSASFRKATRADIPAIRRLISESARSLSAGDYTMSQIESALGSAWQVDTQLICDGTYFVMEAPQMIACGGWSWRGTLFGGDDQEGRQPEALDPHVDAARIRAFFVHPGWARRGIGRSLLCLCEEEARAHGFRTAELIATLSGERLYLSCGYTSEASQEYPLPGGELITFISMRKKLD